MDKPFAIIVEDDRDIVALFRHVLDIAGYHTEIVMDGLEAMQRITAVHPDIVLLDLQLPSMSGVEILKRTKQDEHMMTIPVVVITAYSHHSSSLEVEPDLLLLKPVDINQLSNLVQRLQVTQGAMREPAHERVTGLYTLPFFNVRLTFSLERIKQSMFRQFGVLFVDVTQLEDLRNELQDRDLDTFERKLADAFKSALRPTDTMAWSAEDGMLLTLIEDIPSTDVPLKIAARVWDGLKKHMESMSLVAPTRLGLGVLICDTDYQDSQDIHADIALARTLLRNGQYSSPAIFNREMLQPYK